MNTQDTFLYHGKIDVYTIIKKIKENNLGWDEFVERQKRFDTVHFDTKTIPIIFDKSFNFDHLIKYPTDLYPLFEEDLNHIEKLIIKSTNQNGQIIRAIFVNLPAKKTIEKHIDSAFSLYVARRIHIALETNEQCYFTVGEETRNLKVGELWEINNDKQEHSVENYGDTDRIHLIVDWVDNLTLEKYGFLKNYKNKLI